MKRESNRKLPKMFAGKNLRKKKNDRKKGGLLKKRWCVEKRCVCNC